MRYSLTEGAFILSKFTTGSSITISLYKLSDSSVVSLTSNVMTEVAATGVFKWNTSNITTQPIVFTEYLWIATDGTSSQYGKIVLGGDASGLSIDITDIETAVNILKTKVGELYELQGLELGNPMVINKGTGHRSTNNLTLKIDETPTLTTVTKQ